MRKHICIVSMVVAMTGAACFIIGCNQENVKATTEGHGIGSKGTAHAADCRKMST